MRVIEVEDEGRSDRWFWWTLAGVALGATAGVLVAEKFSGRRPSGRGIWRRAGGLAKTAAGQWLPLLELALEVREMWNEREQDDDLDDADELDHELDDEVEAELEDADEYEEADAPGDPEDALDEDLEEDESEIGLRVLEAFSHDPILAERFVEIEADADGDVILHGRVSAAREVAHAVTIARGVPGVTRVRQRLEVRSRR